MTYSHSSFSSVPNDRPVVRKSGTNTLSGLPRTASAATCQRSSTRHFRRARNRPDEKQEQTIQELFLASRERSVQIAYRVLRNKEDAEDAVQDAFLSACRHFREFEGRSALTTWLTRIVMNAALMVLRKRKNGALRSLDELGTDGSVLADTIPDVQPNPELAYSRAESYEILEAHLKELNPLLREAVVMTYYDELSVTEASSAVGVPPGTYKARLFRGRRLLQQRATLATRVNSRKR